jgi:hypothetical protein
MLQSSRRPPRVQRRRDRLGAAANETDALTEAAKKVQAAAEREEEIQEQVKEAGAALVQIKHLRKGGSGRPPKNGSKSTTIYAQ